MDYGHTLKLFSSIFKIHNSWKYCNFDLSVQTHVKIDQKGLRSKHNAPLYLNGSGGKVCILVFVNPINRRFFI